MTVRLLTPPIVVCSVYVPPLMMILLIHFFCPICIISFLLLQTLSLLLVILIVQTLVGIYSCLPLPSLLSSVTWCMFDLCLAQLVDAPTHTKGGILDLIITNSPDYIQNLCIERTLFSISLSVLQFYQFFHTCDLQVQSSLTILKLILME